MPGDVGVAVGDDVAAVVGVGVGESLADGDALALGVGLGVVLVADAAVQPVSTTTVALAAPSRAKRNGMRIQRQTYSTCAARISAKMRPRHMSYAHSEDASSIRLALGASLRRRRQEAERSLTELAEAAELSPAYLSEVERGLKDVSMDRLLAIAKALEVPVAELYLDLARALGSREAMSQQRSWPDDPKMQLRIATANLRPQALRSVAHFSLYLAATQATPPRRRIGFNLDR
jgi:transcriptional regulator with XRE-family HTH domain